MPKGNPNGRIPTDAEVEAINERREKVGKHLSMRLTYREIAKVLGTSLATVARDVEALRQQWRDRLADSLHDMKAREIADLDEMEREAAVQFLSALNGKDHDLAIKWFDKRLDVKVRRAKMLGLDAPVHHVIDSREALDTIMLLVGAIRPFLQVDRIDECMRAVEKLITDMESKRQRESGGLAQRSSGHRELLEQMGSDEL